jgi:hypothetical protein
MVKAHVVVARDNNDPIPIAIHKASSKLYEEVLSLLILLRKLFHRVRDIGGDAMDNITTYNYQIDTPDRRTLLAISVSIALQGIKK